MADENIEEVGARLTLKDRKKFSSDADRASKDIKKIGDAAKAANRDAQAAASSVTNFARSATSLRAAARIGVTATGTMAAGIGTLGTAATVLGIKTAAGFEQSEIAFGVLLKSQERAKAMISDLRNYAENSPFDLMSVQTGAQRLLAMGFAAKDIMPTMKTLGQAAAGGIVPLEEGMWRLTYALGQMKAAGRVQGDELRQLEEMGIGVRKALAEGFGISMADLPDKIREGALEGDKAIAIIMKTIERDFGGMTDAQAKSWTGMWARMKEVARNNAGDTARAIMDPFKPAFANLGNWADREGKKITRLAQDWKREYGEWQAAGKTGFDFMVISLDSVLGANGRLNRTWIKTKEVSGDLASIWKNSLWPAISDVGAALGPVVAPLRNVDDVLHWMAEHPDAGRLIFEGMAIAITSWKLAELIIGVRNAVIGLNLAMAANPIGLVVTATAALVLGLGILYNKLNAGRPVWEGALAGLFPFMGALLTVRNHLDDILSKLGLIDKKKPGIQGINVGPWAGGYGSQQGKSGGGSVGAMASGGVVTSGGLSLVGERGPELLTLPRGSRVDPLPDGGGSLGPSIVIHPGAISVATSDPRLAARLVVEEIQDMAARK